MKKYAGLSNIFVIESMLGYHLLEDRTFPQTSYCIVDPRKNVLAESRDKDKIFNAWDNAKNSAGVRS